MSEPACTKCSLWQTSRTTSGSFSCVKVPGDGGKPGDVIMMIVGDSPKDADIQFRRAFAGDEGKKFKQMLGEKGLDVNKIHFTYLVKCKNVDKKLSVKSIRACDDHLVEEIQLYKPKVILLLGVTVAKAFGLEGSAAELRGAERWNEKHNCYVFPTYHPFYVSQFTQHAPVYKQFVADLVKAYEVACNGAKSKLKVDYQYATTIAEAEKFKKIILAEEWFAEDTETTSLDFKVAELLLASFAVAPGVAFTIPYKHPEVFASPTGQREIKRILKEINESANNKIFHNAKYDVKILWHEDIEVRKVAFDTMLAHYLLDENSPHGLAVVASTFTDIGAYKDEVSDYITGGIDITESDTDEESEEDDEEEKKPVIRESTILDCPLDKLNLYAARDVDATFRAYTSFRPMLEQEGSIEVFKKILMPLCYVLAKMEYRGIAVDREYVNKLATKYADRFAETQMKILGSKPVLKFMAAHPKLKEFKLNSVKNKRELFYDKAQMGLVPPAYNKLTKIQKAAGKTQGTPKVDAKTLQELVPKHKIFQDLLDYAKVKKFQEYVKGYKKLAEMYDDGIIHTNYKQHGTVTGRLSSTQPNLQNIPKHDAEDETWKRAQELRNVFVSRPGYTFIEADFSSAEFFIWAVCSKDKKLMEFLLAKDENGEYLDIHKQVASSVLGIPQDRVSKNQRNLAKTIVYGLMYGRSNYSIAKEFGLPDLEVERFVNGLFSNFTEAMTWITEQPLILETKGFVTSIFGRRRRIQGIYSKDPKEQEESKRQARNFPVQSGAGDTCFKAMIMAYRELQKLEEDTAYLVLQIHDSVVFEVRDDKVQEVVPIIQKSMEDAIRDLIPMRVGIDYGKRFGEMKKWEDGTEVERDYVPDRVNMNNHFLGSKQGGI